jgi:hypothetical protein
MTDKVKKIFEELRIAAEKDLKILKNTDFIDEDLSVTHNKRIKASLISIGKSLVKYSKNPINFLNEQWNSDNKLHNIILIDGKLYEVYEDEKEDFQKMTEDEKKEELNQTDLSIFQLLVDDFLYYEEGDTRDNLPYEIFKNSSQVMKKFDDCIV